MSNEFNGLTVVFGDEGFFLWHVPLNHLLLVLLPPILVVSSVVLYLLGWLRNRANGTPGTFPSVMMGVSLGVTLLDVFCFLTFLADTMTEYYNGGDQFSPELLVAGIAWVIWLFAMIIPALGLSLLGAFLLSRHKKGVQV